MSKATSRIVGPRSARTIAVAGIATVLILVGVVIRVAHTASQHGGREPLAATSNASCRDTGLRPTRATSTRAAAATLCLVNVQRARHAEHVLRRNADLGRSAISHSQDMVSANYFEHVSPAGVTPLDRIKASTYLLHRSTYVIGENIAVGVLQLSTPSAIVAGWMRSPEHRANILNPDFRDSGIGIVAHAPGRYSGGQRGATYTQQFGVTAQDQPPR